MLRLAGAVSVQRYVMQGLSGGTIAVCKNNSYIPTLNDVRCWSRMDVKGYDLCWGQFITWWVMALSPVFSMNSVSVTQLLTQFKSNGRDWCTLYFN